MGPAEIYATSRRRLLDLAPSLSAEQRAAPLPPTPPWTVTDGYRHLAGVCCDVLDGNMPQGGPHASEEWTAAQLATRASWSLEQVCEQWAERAPALDDVVEAAGPKMGFVALDSWVHEQDVRAGAGVGALHHDELLPWLIALTVGAADRFYTSKGGPTLRLLVDGEERVVGDGEPAVTLETNAYELMRIVFGRRSPAQIAAAAWSGPEADAAQQAITLFPAQEQDLID
jgi:uncharacterized protein (TIGR03083 family)